MYKNMLFIIVLLSCMLFQSKLHSAYAVTWTPELVDEATKRAHNGDPEAQCVLGFLYQTGQGVQQNFETAIMWYEKSAKQGYPRAQTMMGQIYLQGAKGITPNLEKARQWYEKASAQNYAPAQAVLCSFYEYGRAGKQDMYMAKKLYCQACEGGVQHGCNECRRITGSGF